MSAFCIYLTLPPYLAEWYAHTTACSLSIWKTKNTNILRFQKNVVLLQQISFNHKILNNYELS